MSSALRQAAGLTLRALRNLQANPLLNLATVFIIAVSLFVVSTFALFVTNLERSMDGLGDDPRVSGYLSESVSRDDGVALTARLAQRPEVASADYVSKEEALARFTEAFESVAGLLEDLGDNPLPASIEITLRPGLEKKTIEGFVASLPRTQFEEVDWGQGWAERFSRFVDTVRAAAVGLGGLLLVASTLMIANTIHLTVYARRDELNILRLVGATGLFIRVPFVLEGLLQGLLGAGAAVGGLYLAFSWASPLAETWLHRTLGARDLSFLPPSQVAALFALGAGIAVMANLLSLQRYLRQPVVAAQ